VRNLKKLEWAVLIGLLLLSLVPCVVGLFRLVEQISGPGLLPDNPRVRLAPIPAVFHILTAVPYCILGAFQFLPTIRRQLPRWHQVSGRILVGVGILSAFSGLWMTHFYSFSSDLQGDLLYFVRIIVGFSMIVCILLGLSAVMKKRIVHHQAWMMRAYALGQGAGTQVLITIPWVLTVGEPVGFIRDVLMTLAWVINMILVEWLINARSNRIDGNTIKSASSTPA